MLQAPSSLNLAADLFERNRGRAGKLAYVDDGRRLSYGELERDARRFAAALLALGLRREERVLLLMLDSCDWPVAFLGCLAAGIIPVAVNTLLSADDYAFMLGHSRAQAVLVSAPLLPVLETALQAAPNEVAHIVVSGAVTSTAPPQSLPASLAASLATPASAAASQASALRHVFCTLVDSATPSVDTAQTGADEAAFWLYSSGSTGKPKGTVHTHGNAWHTIELYGKGVLGLRESDVCFSAAKLYFAYGLGNALTFPLSVGASVVLMAERPTPAAVFKRWTGAAFADADGAATPAAMADIDLRPTVFFGAPTGYAGMLASPALPPRSAVALRMASSAGEALPAEIGQRFERHFGCPVIDGIGSTEMLHVYCSNRPGDVRYGSTGTPVPGYELELRSDDGQPVADGEVGDLYIAGPSAALLYWADRERTRETFQGRWTKSGDKYSRDAAGTYTYAGRSDDMLKVSGVYVSPFEIEATLMQHPAVLESAVIGVEDSDGLTKSKAFVVVKPGMMASEAELKSFVKERLAAFKYPRSIEFVAELPKTATGKIQRFRLRERERGSL